MAEINLFIISFLITFLLWLPQAISQVLTWTYWLQVKEYRWDRFWDFLKSGEGRKKLGFYPILLKLLGLTLIIFYPLIPLFLIVFIYLDIVFLKRVFTKTVRKPIITERIKKIWLTSLVGIFVTLATLNFFIGEVLLIVTPFLGILWTIPIVERIKKEEIAKAKKVLKKFRPTVIGITGSYGKTTTKDFVAHLLSQKYKVAKTEGSENTEFGIARKTFKNVSRGTKYFVVEMGAYKRGEIEKLTSIVNPSVGIITGIEAQHISLFGSLENIKKAKYELIDSLPKKGVAIFNFSNSHSRELAQSARLKTKLDVLGYFVSGKRDEKTMEADIYSKVLSVNHEKIAFVVHYKGQVKKLSVNLPGLHFLENLTCAILVAKLFKLSWDEIEKACRDISLPENTMDVVKLKSGAIVIDDTHNSTPLAFESAVSYLSYFKNKKKIVITSGIIELGDESASIHKHIGREMADKVDQILLTNSDFYESLNSGLEKFSYKLKLEKKLPISKIKKLLSSDDAAILLEGRLPTQLMDVIDQAK